MFCAPFVLLGVSYGAAPPELPVLRSWIAHTMLSAPKSLFMVFRVPVINLIHGLMAAVMLSYTSAFEKIGRRILYSNLFSMLLFTIALKSDFEAMELSLATTRKPERSCCRCTVAMSSTPGVGSRHAVL